MQLVTRATSIAAVAVVFISMLMQIASAVEVTSEPSPPPPSDNCFILGSRSFSIPFSVDSAGAQPVEVHLFVSRGPDDTWRLLDRKKPDVPQKQFQFEADRDGEFWFATRTIDALGRSHPAGEIESQLKVYVDTTKPNVTLQADADADGRVEVTVSIHDATKLKDMQLRYVTDNLKQWVSVDLGQLSAEGRLQFLPADAWTQLSVQLIVSDTPGNQSVVNQLLRRPRLADAEPGRFAIAPSRASTDAIAMPYRIDPNDPLAAQAVSSPVIKLDRHQSRPVSNVTTAQGYAPDASPQGSSPFYGFRDAQSPMSQSPMSQSPMSQSPMSQSPMSQSTGSAIPGMAFAPPPALAPAPQPGQPQGVQPQSLFSRLFGSAPAPPTQTYPAPSYPGQPYPYPGQPYTNPSNSIGPNNQSQLGFGPPSVRGTQVQSRFAGSVEEGLPAPATPEQISNGFDLNSPGQSLPETIPVPSNPEPSPPPQRPRPKTPAEAMRPITESSESSLPVQEEVPAPQGEPDPYQSRRATPSPGPTSNPGPAASPAPASNLAGDVANMMERAPVRYSDSARFSLEYELEAVGVQGVEAIELYGSTDGGRSWDLWGRDPDRTSPFDIETKDAGVFGFRIVVVGRNGLASPRPLSGETPDIVVVVDSQRPIVRITGAQYGEGDRIGSLVIRYQCEDANLKQRPISLSFSDSLEGPWTTIAAGLRNDGEYIWTADPNLPRQLFLRIDATDEAGNTGSYVLDQPIDAQGLAPRARIRGLQTLSGSDLPSGEGQTAKGPKALFK